MSGHLAAIIGGAAGALALVGIVIFFIWFCLSHKRSVSRTSETGSSEPSSQVGRHVGVELSLRETRRFEMEELSVATKNFSDINLIGEGKLGRYIRDCLMMGCLWPSKSDLEHLARNLLMRYSTFHLFGNRNLVILLGYCQENNQQFLIYEYIPNGSFSSHFYGTGKHSREKLEFKHRVSIALGQLKVILCKISEHLWLSCLAHLHSQSPRLIHKDFKTANVLVDENSIAKVADAGLRNFLGRVDIAGPSSQVTADEIFLAPEVREFRRFSEKSDVYSFGVFVLELVSGQEATESSSFDSNQNLVEWVNHGSSYNIDALFICYVTLLMQCKDYSKFSNIIDHRLENTFTAEAMEGVIQLIVRCVEPSSERRPAMSYVVMELDRILDKEVRLTTVMGEGTPTVTLGSHLFTATN
ncbi:hypothetical protein SLA2020_453350 [Shorea laevis]